MGYPMRGDTATTTFAAEARLASLAARTATVSPMLFRRRPAAPTSAREATDAELVAIYARDGDRQAFDTLFLRHKQAVYSVLWSLSGNRAITEDLSQHCWLRLIEAIGNGSFRVTEEGSVRSYLIRVGRNRYIDEYQRKHAESRTDSLTDADEPAGASPGAAEAAADTESGDRIGAAIAALPAEQRDVVALWLHGCTIKEMVAITGAPRDTVLSRTKYALKKLRGALAALRPEADAVQP